VLYYESVLATMGKKQEDWMRLFMVPGMQHCSGGSGTDQFNKMAVLERWREGGEAPAQIVASHVTGGQVDMTVRCARIRRRPSTKARARPTTPPAFRVRRRSASARSRGLRITPRRRVARLSPMRDWPPRG